MHTPPIPDFVPWTAAYFHSERGRDRFLSDVAIQQKSDVEVEPMPDESRGARVRWRPGNFLGLNDVAHANGGRIVVAVTNRRGRA